jgi:hypothetical protein
VQTLHASQPLLRVLGARPARPPSPLYPTTRGNAGGWVEDWGIPPVKAVSSGEW